MTPVVKPVARITPTCFNRCSTPSLKNSTTSMRADTTRKKLK